MLADEAFGHGPRGQPIPPSHPRLQNPDRLVRIALIPQTLTQPGDDFVEARLVRAEDADVAGSMRRLYVGRVWGANDDKKDDYSTDGSGPPDRSGY
jgi:hypothetical protein